MGKSFKVTSGKMVISDPIFELGAWCQGIVNAKNGDWDVDIIMDQSSDKVKRVIAWNINSAQSRLGLSEDVLNGGELPFSFWVDSGMFSYYDHGKVINEQSDLFNGKEKYGVYDSGVIIFCSNGSYSTLGIKDSDGNYIALCTTFIEDHNYDYDDDTSWDEDLWDESDD